MVGVAVRWPATADSKRIDLSRSGIGACRYIRRVSYIVLRRAGNRIRGSRHSRWCEGGLLYGKEYGTGGTIGWFTWDVGRKQRASVVVRITSCCRAAS